MSFKQTSGISDVPDPETKSAGSQPATPRETENDDTGTIPPDADGKQAHAPKYRRGSSGEGYGFADNGQAEEEPTKPREWFRFYTVGECQSYTPPEGHVLVGDCHLARGCVCVLGGAPGIGKSRAGTSLAVAGATGADWFGMKVHQRFRTAILQNENGRHRLKSEFAELNATTLDDWIRVSEPPPFGLAFDSEEFRCALASWLAEFKPDLVIFDPWNGITRDDKQRDYREAFDNVFSVLPKGDEGPAIMIVAHTRKPKADERRNGRSLLNELSGSHSLGSVARCVFVMEAGSNDGDDDRIVWTCAKNNNGQLGERSAWHRRNGLFAPCPDFDWQTFDGPSAGKREAITRGDLHAVFEGGHRRMTRKVATEALMEATGYMHSACYDALSKNGRFAANLREDENGVLSWTP